MHTFSEAALIGDITNCIKTLFLLYFKFVKSETKESFVLGTNALLVGTLISTGDISLH